QQELKDLRVTKGHKVQLVQQELKAAKDRKVQVALKGHKVQLV
ncbi:hypothetical protein SAMN04487970_1008141, partial [Paenibacillus tianmuensis]